MAKFTITLSKGIQSHREHVEGDALSARLNELTVQDTWTLDNVERDEEDTEEFVRFGSEGQRVEYEDADDASEHRLRMMEGLC